MELRNRNTLTWTALILSISSFLIFASFLGAFRYFSFPAIFNNFETITQFTSMFQGGFNSALCGVVVILSFVFLIFGLIFVALIKRKRAIKILFIVYLITFCLIAIWSALTLFKSKDEINIFLENWQSATYNGVDITAFYFMIGAFASFVVFSVILMYFLLFTKQLGKEKTIEEIIEVEEIIDEPREKVIETELYPEESVVEPDIPEDKVIEKKVSKALKTEEKSEPVKVIVEEEEDILKDKEETKEKIKQEEAKIASAKNEKKTSKRLSFEERLELADQDLKDIYSEIKKYIEGYGIKARMSKTGESYRLHTVRYLKITIAGKKLKLYYNLDPNKYKDTPIPFQDVSDKKVYKDIPFAFKVKSDLSIKRAKKLIDDMLENVELD